LLDRTQIGEGQSKRAKSNSQKTREEANKSGGQSPKSQQQEQNAAFIAASNRQKWGADQSKEADISTKWSPNWSLYCSPMQPLSRSNPAKAE
jgi:hypothetical protein